MSRSTDQSTAPPPDPPPGGDDQNDLADALAVVLARIDEVRSHVERLVAVQVDRARIKLRERMVRVVAWWLVGAALAAATVCGTVYVLSGLTGGLSVAFGDRVWAGELAGGAIVLCGVAAVFVALVAWRRRVGFDRMARRYRRRDAEEARAAAGVPHHEGKGVSR